MQADARPPAAAGARARHLCYSSAFLSGRKVTNILLQSQCSLDQGEHLSMPYEHIADADVLDALDAAHPVTAPCTPVLPVIGG